MRAAVIIELVPLTTSKLSEGASKGCREPRDTKRQRTHNMDIGEILCTFNERSGRSKRTGTKAAPSQRGLSQGGIHIRVGDNNNRSSLKHVKAYLVKFVLAALRIEYGGLIAVMPKMAGRN